jgi:hypothetical protein
MPRHFLSTIKCLRVVPDRNGEIHPAEEFERPIAAWIDDGFTELSIYCGPCRAVMPRPLLWLCGGRSPGEIRLVDLLDRLRCARCGTPPSTIKPEKPVPTYRYQYGDYRSLSSASPEDPPKTD